MTEYIAAASVAAPLVLGLFFIIGAATLSEKHAPLRIILFLLSIVTFWSAENFLLLSVHEYMTFPALEDLIGTTIYWTGWVFFILVSYFAIYMIYLMSEHVAQKKKERLEY